MLSSAEHRWSVAEVQQNLQMHVPAFAIYSGGDYKTISDAAAASSNPTAVMQSSWASKPGVQISDV